MIKLPSPQSYLKEKMFEYLTQLHIKQKREFARVQDLSDLTPPQITSSINDYDPWSGEGEVNVLRLSADISVVSHSFVQAFDVTAQENDPGDVFFKPDGTKMYVIGATGDDVNEYDLSTPWDISSAVFLQLFSVVAKEALPRGVFFKPDGTKMYIVGASSDSVHEYDLSTPWSVLSAIFLQTFDVSSEDINPNGVVFKFDGTKMYVVGQNDQDINEYNLSIPWDISSAVFLHVFDVSAELTGPTGMSFAPTGEILFVSGTLGTEKVARYSLSTAWNISTAVIVDILSVEAEESAQVSGVFLRPDETQMFIVGIKAPASVRGYSLTGSAIIITGFATGRKNRKIHVINVGAGNIALANQDTLSIEKNRVITGINSRLTLTPDTTGGVNSATLYYDDATTRWRVIV